MCNHIHSFNISFAFHLNTINYFFLYQFFNYFYCRDYWSLTKKAKSHIDKSKRDIREGD